MMGKCVERYRSPTRPEGALTSSRWRTGRHVQESTSPVTLRDRLSTGLPLAATSWGTSASISGAGPIRLQRLPARQGKVRAAREGKPKGGAK